MRRSLAAVCVLAIVLGGCARGAEAPGPIKTIKPSFTASSPSATATAKHSVACKLLTSRERRSIAGEKIDVVVPVQAVKDIDQCRWVKTLSGPPTTVQVIMSSAQVWARTIPQQVDGALKTGQADDDTIKRLLAAKKKVRRGASKLSDAEACKMFSLMAEVNKRKKGTTLIVNFPPFGTQVSANARTCTHGVYTSVMYSELGLRRSAAVSQAVTRLLLVAHKRATKIK
jgi:hypothetical protein